MKEKRPEENQSSIVTRIKEHPYITEFAVLAIVAAIIGGIFLWQHLASRIAIESAQVVAPIIALSPEKAGILDKIRVAEGEMVGKGAEVATVGYAPIRTRTQGVIVSVLDAPGQYVTSQQAVVKMVDPREFRVIGRIDEDKGLSEIRPGQRAVFTVDAFGSKEYQGTVEMVMPSARSQDIVFSISDKRQVQQFDVKVKFDIEKYPELRNGMSAKVWVYK